jgi:hypothetical protein
MTEMPKSPSFQRSGSDHEVIPARQFTRNYLGGITIVRFDVPMDDTSLVHVLHGASELRENVPDF